MNGKRSWEADDASASDFSETLAKKPRTLSQDPNSWLRAPVAGSPVSYLGFKHGVSRAGVPMTSAGMVFANDKENQEAGQASSEFDYSGGYMTQSPYMGQDGDDLIDPRLL